MSNLNHSGYTEELFKPEMVERKSEILPVSYEDYAAVCNINNDGSRRRGILSDEVYAAVMADASTDLIESNGKALPLLIDINYGFGMGYDLENCKDYVGDLSDQIKVLSLPVHELNDDEKLQAVEILKSYDDLAIYLSDHNNDELGTLRTLVEAAGKKMVERPMLEASAGPGDEQAALYLYSFIVNQTEAMHDTPKTMLKDVKEYYDKNLGPQFIADGEVMTSLELGSNITDEQADKIWDLYLKVFTELGKKNHPISMQDSKEDFLGLLRSENSMLAATYVKDESGEVNQPICFTFYVDDISKLYWLNQNYLEDYCASVAKSNRHTAMFTPGLVSDAHCSYSAFPINLFTKTASLAGISTVLLYENTNVSKRYIPRIVDRCVSRACEHSEFIKSELLDEVSYRLFHITDNEA